MYEKPGTGGVGAGGDSSDEEPDLKSTKLDRGFGGPNK
jgi:hypothetical protein